MTASWSPMSRPTLAEDPSLTTTGLARRKPRDRALLVRVSGLDAGRPHLLAADEITLGRGRACGLRLEELGLSRVHARLLRKGDGFLLEDMGSMNGTFVNDERVERRELLDGDRVRLGSETLLRFHVVDADEELAMTRIYEASSRDPLTGVYNRKQLDERLAAELALASRQSSELSLVLVDVDHFKRVNDELGHAAGDQVLIATARAIGSAIRAEDVLARFGGEEFVIVARGLSVAQSEELAERVRSRVEACSMAAGEARVRVTVSAGVASLRCAQGDPRRLLAKADERLYRAKSSGRNRVVAREA